MRIKVILLFVLCCVNLNKLSEDFSNLALSLQGDKSIKKYGSQGQIRTCVMNLKLSECEIIKNILEAQEVCSGLQNL